MTHKAMAGAYVRPLVEALAAINAEMQEQSTKREKFAEMARGYLPAIEQMGVPAEYLEKMREVLQ